MTRVEVDRSKCVGLGVCESVMPELFEIDDDGVLVLLGSGTVKDSELAEVEAAIRGCPVEALTLLEE